MDNKQNHPVPEFKVRIDRTINKDGSRVRAIASVSIAGSFAVHGVKIVDGQDGPFVQMPQNSYEKGGKRQYEDIFHPITSEARSALSDAVLRMYEKEMREAEGEAMEAAAADQRM